MDVEKRFKAFFLAAGILTTSLLGCSRDVENENEIETDENISQQSEVEQVEEAKSIKLTLDENTKYQVIESFGASGAWWAQDVGGWSELNDEGIEVREQIATLLYDKEKGIGLTNFRYNIGAGTADSGNSFQGITDVWRRAESFEVEAGIYDWSKDANAVWMMDKALELGVSELVFFCNSPVERLTKNNKGYADKAAEGETTSNLPKENYREFAEYVLDIVEHFIEEGYPIKYVSPVNEPQWEWAGGQEGCHYEPDELVEFLNVFLDVMEERKIEGLELSAPELGEWGNTSYDYYNAIFADERLKEELKTLDVHSYWTDTATKKKFKEWLAQNGIDVELKASEWCEMVNGKDKTMDSALELAKVITVDLTELDVTSWQYWIAVSCYNYRDGLIYVNTATKDVWETKRLWAMGNFSRFIKEGYERVEITEDGAQIMSVAFKGKNEDTEELVVVLTNIAQESYSIDMADFQGYSSGEVYVTDEEHSLERVIEIDGSTKNIEVPKQSVVTIVLTK